MWEDRVRGYVRQVGRRVPGLYNWRNEHEALVRRLRGGGLHEPDFAVLRRLDVIDPVVLDVGANAGQSVLSIKSVLPGASIISVEPSTVALPGLLRTARRYRDVEVATFAAGAEFGVATLSIPEVGGILLHQDATLGPMDAASVLLRAQASGFTWARSWDVVIRRTHCLVAPLDEAFTTCDVLKVDVEGFEDEVFAGATQLVSANLPVIVVERPSTALQNTLLGVGYSVVGTPPSQNTVFAHPSRHRGLLD